MGKGPEGRVERPQVQGDPGEPGERGVEKREVRKGHLLAVAEQSVLLLANLDGGTAELGDEDPVTGDDAHGDALAVAVEGARTDGENLGLVEVLDGGLGEEDARGSLGLGLDALDEHAVEEGDEGADGAEGRL